MIVNAPRKSGKTTALIAWVAQNPERHVIVTHSAQEARRLHLAAYLWALEHNFLPVSNAYERLRHKQVTIAIDNAEMMRPQDLSRVYQLGCVQHIVGSWS